MKKYTLTELKTMTESEFSDTIVETVKSNGDYYLDRLGSNQWLVSFCEFPKVISDSYLDAERWFTLLSGKKYQRSI